MHPLAAASMRRIKQSQLGVIWNRAAELERADKDIIHFEIGRPDFDTPDPIKKAATRAMQRGDVHYTVPRGLPELRQAIAQDLSLRLGLDLDPDHEVVVTIGAVEGIFVTLLTVLDAGGEVLVPEPLYPFYHGWAEFLGGKTVPLSTSEQAGYQISPESLSQCLTSRSKVIIVNSPRNPTGSGLDEKSLQAAAQAAREHNLLVISDEVYDRIVFQPYQHQSIAALPGMKERTVIINTFSKSFAMDGWRIGYLAGPADLVQEMDKAHLRTSTCANTMAQYGALEALRLGSELVDPMVETYARRRRLIIDIVAQAPGLSCLEPQGTFYLWLNYGDIGVGELEVAQILLERAGVAVTPGSEFGPSVKGHLRISFATSRAQIEKGMQRLTKALADI
ncbi:MAG: pyridoxal phosphate-dependent aminotransferase [Desulfarculaceae bacterium]|jgi:aspartate/methionine/tyrosine aminotransferase